MQNKMMILTVITLSFLMVGNVLARTVTKKIEVDAQVEKKLLKGVPQVAAARCECDYYKYALIAHFPSQCEYFHTPGRAVDYEAFHYSNYYYGHDNPEVRGLSFLSGGIWAGSVDIECAVKYYLPKKNVNIADPNCASCESACLDANSRDIELVAMKEFQACIDAAEESCTPFGDGWEIRISPRATYDCDVFTFPLKTK